MTEIYDPDSGEQMTETLEDSLSTLRAEIHALGSILVAAELTTAEEFQSLAAAMLGKIDQVKERKRRQLANIRPLAVTPIVPGVYVGNAEVSGARMQWTF